MSTLEIWLLAIGLAMDCLAVSIASGIYQKKSIWQPMLTMAFFFGLFQGTMPLLGWLGASTFSHLIENFDHWIAFGLLTFLGVRMIRESQKEEECKEGFDPSNLKVIITLAIATSIDALAVGVSFALLDIDTIREILFPVCIIAFASFLFSIVGYIVGNKTQNSCKLRAELWGGLILIFIAVKILIEHLFIQQ